MTSRTGVRRRLRPALLCAATALLAVGCSLDVTNPNAAPEDQVLTTPAGLRALATGLQGRFGNSLEHAAWVPGVVSGELGNTDASLSTSREFQKYPTASANSPRIEVNNPDLLNFWSRQYAVVKTANDVLTGVDNVTGLQPGTRAGLTALARTLQAAAFGTLIQAWEQIPLDPEEAQPTFSDRAAVLARVLELLAAARTDLVTPVTPEFTGLLLPGFDLPNTIRALQARHSLVAGQYAQALAFANEVPAAATSEYRFSTVDPDPLWQAITANRYFAAIATFRTNAEPGDVRVNRNTGPTVTTPFGGAQVVPIITHPVQSGTIAIFTQDELTLIRAEAQARLNQLPAARTEVNRVRTAAGLAPRDDAALATQQAILDEIFRQRQYSLFLSGLKWGDQRRFGRIADARTTWLPIPAQETVGNPNAPANP